MPQQISEEEFAEWLVHPVTRAFRERAQADLDARKESWSLSEFNDNPLRDAKVRGECAILTQIVNLDFSDVKGN